MASTPCSGDTSLEASFKPRVPDVCPCLRSLCQQRAGIIAMCNVVSSVVRYRTEVARMRPHDSIWRFCLTS